MRGLSQRTCILRLPRGSHYAGIAGQNYKITGNNRLTPLRRRKIAENCAINR